MTASVTTGPQAAPNPTPQAAAPGDKPLNGVLYVDHDHEARLVLERFLERVGPVRTVTTLADARTAVAAEPPALLVIDPALPDGNGTALIAEVRAQHPWAQIFAIPRTAWADQTRRFIAAGANDVAAKPFDVGKLVPRAEALLRAAQRAREELASCREQEMRLAHVERVATLGTMLAAVVQEAATPLSTLNANADALAGILRGGQALEPQRAELREAATEIRAAAVALQSLVQRVRMFSRRDERKRVRASLGPVVESALALVKPRLAGHSIKVRAPEGEAPVLPHFPIRLTQALINLLTNAIEAIGPAREGTITLRWLDEGDVAGIAIEDDGPGLGDEARARMSEPFFTSKTEGTGLGLVLVRAILREHEGKLELVPAPSGGGLSARLLLPRAVEERPTIV
jgi:C4-dicarboxylate-specific signal transduction histidine kinase